MDFKRYINSLGLRQPEEGPYVSAIIVAAGSSTRMGGVNKQFLPLCGVPTLARTLSAFEASVHVREVVIVTKKPEIFKVGNIIKEFGFTKISKIVAGGMTRQDSAAMGFDAISDEAEFVAVHDGARPLITAECIDRIIEDAYKTRASAAAVPVKDTLKIADENGNVISTPERNSLFAVQTPQVFERKLYAEALKKAEESGETYTDDCQLIENMDVRVHLCEGDYKNIKITTAEDVTRAEAYIRARGDAL